MKYGDENQSQSTWWSRIKQYDNILWIGLFLIACICLVEGCGPAAELSQDPSMKSLVSEGPVAETADPKEDSVMPLVDAPAGSTEKGTESAETKNPDQAYKELEIPSYAAGTYAYYIEELDVTLDIPEGMYVYRADSIRRHYDGSWFRLDCCEWILVTDKQYEEPYLTGNLMSELEKEAKHLVFGLVLTKKELAPLARLFPSIVPRSDVRVTEDWYCEILRNSTRLMTEDGGYATLPAEDCVRWYDTDLSVRLTERIREKTLGTDSLNQEGDYLLVPGFTEENAYQNTMLNSYWWQGYCQAVEELTEHPEEYEYDDENVTAIMDLMGSLRETDSKYWYDGQAITDIYIDQSEDIYLRAYYYANSYAYYMGDEELTIPLKDIIVGFQDWNNSQRSYTICLADGSFFYSMSDHMVDLQPSYRYLKDHELLPE